MFPPVLLAALEDLLGFLPILIPIIIWIGAQVLGGDKNQPPKRNQPPRPVKKPPQGGGAPQVQPKDAAVRDEIEAFLKRAADKRKPEGQQQPDRLRPVEAAAAPGKPKRQQPKRPATSRPQSSRPVMAESAERRSDRTNWHGDVSQHVKEHIGGDDIAKRTSLLGEEVSQSDEQLESHLHQVFDHKVGNLDSSAASASLTPTSANARTVPNPAARAIYDMLRSPAGVQQAILIGEILKRPDFD